MEINALNVKLSHIIHKEDTGVFDNITTPQNGMIDRIAEAFQYFEQLQTNVHSKLHIKRYLMISSIRYGFEYVCQQFCNHYQDPNSNGKILDGVFLRPSRGKR
eukprot:165853_1